jgi:hypothetical protein
LPNGLTRVHSTTGNRISPLEAADCCHNLPFVTKQASHNLTEGSCFYEHSWDVAIIFIIKICICCVHASQVSIFRESAIRQRRCFVTIQTMRTSPDLKVNAASAGCLLADEACIGADFRERGRVLAQGGTSGHPAVSN